MCESAPYMRLVTYVDFSPRVFSKSMFMRPLLLLGLFLWSVTSFAQSGNSRVEYINKYKEIAILEMERTGIPASIKLAQAILESGAGESYLATKGNNHFGIKCHSEWKGKKVYRKDDDFVDGKLVESCFRKYEKPEQSFIDHSEFLRDPKKVARYGPLFELDPFDYKAWAKGLRRSGYATNPYYDKSLIKIIETYELNQYDKRRSVDTDIVDTKFETGITRFNDVKMIVAKAGESVTQVSIRAGQPLLEVLKYNEKIGPPDTKLAEGARVYLQPKRRSYRGQTKYHYVQEGETMFSISQQYGVKLDRLYKRNRLDEGSEPAIGERLKLKGWKIKKDDTPKTRRPGYQPPTGRPGDLEMDDSEPDDQPAPPVIVPVDPPVTGESPFGNDDTNIPSSFPATTNPPSTPPTTTTDTNPPSTTPTPTPTPPSTPTTPEPQVDTPNAQYHTVVKGETLYRLFVTYGTPVETIKRWNGLTDNIISVGQRIRVR